MAKVPREALQAARARAAALRAASAQSVRRAREAVDKARNTAQVTAFRRALRELVAKVRKTR